MRKKISLILVFTFVILLCGCSRETKMGIGEFSDRLHKDYGLTLSEESVLLEKNGEENTIYCNINSYLFIFYLGSNNKICEIAGILPKEDADKLTDFLDTYEKCVSVFTLNSEDNVKSTFKECGISAESIKFTDSNFMNTVGKFKYSVISNELSVTCFCKQV